MNARWFNRNPKKSILLISMAISMVLLLCADAIVAAISPLPSYRERYIVLREPPPLLESKISPSPYQWQFIDGLPQREFTLRVDENGYVMPSAVHDEADLKIVFLGGSTTMSRFVDETKRFPYLVGQQLSKRLRLRVNSYNGAMAGNVTMHSIASLLNKDLALSPEIVVLMHNLNDLNLLLYEGTYWNSNPTRRLIFEREEHSPTYYIMNALKDIFAPTLYERIRILIADDGDEFGRSRRDKASIQGDRYKEEFRASLEIFVRICLAKEIVPVLLTQFNRITDNPDENIRKQIEDKITRKTGVTYVEYKEMYRSFNDAIRSVARNERAVLIDLDQQIDKVKTLIYDVCHVNNRGSEVVAENITEALSGVIGEMELVRRNEREVR